MAELTGKVALVSGAGQGVGQGIALALAAAGAAVALAGRTLAKVEATAATITTRGGRALPVLCDVFDGAQISAAVAQCVQQLGGVDILVNNAYDGAFGPLLSLDDEAFMRGIRSGPLASFRFMRACYPHFKARGGGHVVNLATSAAVRWDSSNYGAYAVAKQGIRALTRAAASEWGRDNIRVNTIVPLASSPAMARWVASDPEGPAFIRTVPLQRVGDCEADIGRAVVALVGTGMGYVSGATIPLDGGQSYFG
ncbi:MAG: SDR family oxidoreductase [Proteobacteria bacterium]|nr:SDR family oxidoreductase [Pseudomonadota bacterium]